MNLKRKFLPLFMLLIISGVILRCSNNPELIFPEEKNTGKVTGFINPAGVKATVYLIDIDTIATTSPYPDNGYYSFTDVPYGSYQIKVVADSFGVITLTFSLSRSVISLSTLNLSRYPSQINRINPKENSSFSHLNNSCFSDSTFDLYIEFKKHMSIANIDSAFSVSPPLPIRISRDEVSEFKHEIYFSIPIFDFFQYPQVTVTLNTKFSTVYFEPLDFDYSIHYYPDTSLYEQAIFRYFISETVPRQSASNVDVNTDVVFKFRKLMNHFSVENAVSIEPDILPDFSWQVLDPEGEELIIQFAKPLDVSTYYTIKLDTTLVTLDSVNPQLPLYLSFKTEYFRILSHFPINGDISITPDAPFTYITNFPVDSVSFVNAFSISPNVDSLSYRFFNNKQLIEVTHSSLIPDSQYKITIDSTLTTSTGIKYDRFLYQNFTTGISSDTILDSTLISGTYPPDTAELLDCNGDVLVIFTVIMNRQSVENRISLSPNLIFEGIWRSNDTLQINQLQQFMSNTIYSVEIDSGYKTYNGEKTGIKYGFSFKTKPVRLDSFYPLYGQVNVALDSRVVLEFNTPVDSTSLISNIFFTPAVDSLQLSISDSGLYYLDHMDFLQNTKYMIMLSDSITDKYGVIMEKAYTIEFTTTK